MLDTLDLQSFLAEWTVLLERFGREPSEAVALGYYESLKGLTVTEFKFAARRIFVECDTLPSPKRILEMIHPPAKDRAILEWDAILTAIARGKYPELSESGARALRSVGGRDTVGQANINTEVPHLRRTFIESYVSFDRMASMSAMPRASQPELPPTTTDTPAIEADFEAGEVNEANIEKLRKMTAQIGGGFNGKSNR